MIISRTPFRISFFGGGTDYPVWYREHGGAVLATTFDKYCYITCRYLPPFFDCKHRIVYSNIESVKDVSEIEHPSVKATFEYLNVNESGVEIHHVGDLPAKTGLGSSSSFTVGLLNGLYALRGEMCTKNQLAKEAIHIEQNIIKETVGSQDQVSAAFGGFNYIKFNQDDSFSQRPVTLSKEKFAELEKSIMLYYTGISRFASDIAKVQVETTPKKKKELMTMREMVDEAMDILNSKTTDLGEFGKLLHESWKLKRSLTDKISTPHITEIYEEGMRAGALGGKILGAGGGGFMIFFAKPEDQPKIEEKMGKLLRIPFNFENQGSQIVVYQPELSDNITR